MSLGNSSSLAFINKYLDTLYSICDLNVIVSIPLQQTEIRKIRFTNKSFNFSSKVGGEVD